MPNLAKRAFLVGALERLGRLHKLPGSQSMYELTNGSGVIYVRYSRLHPRGRTFYGLRKEDVRFLEGRRASIAFLWDGQDVPLLVPFAEFEDVFRTTPPAADGQYKAQVYLQSGIAQLYIARAGRFNVDAHLGWHNCDLLQDGASKAEVLPDLSHSQVQTLIADIGTAKGFAVWVPLADRDKLDWSMTSPLNAANALPPALKDIHEILAEVDVLWLKRGSLELRSLFEVEHSTTIYSGLLRFNDVLLAAASVKPAFSIVADDERRNQFLRQVNRLTFRASGLSEICTFMNYANVYAWHGRIRAAPMMGEADGQAIK